VRYSVFVLRVWKYPNPNANKPYIWTHIFWQCGVGVAQSILRRATGWTVRWGARFSVHIKTDPGAHQPTRTLCSGSFLGFKCRRFKHPPSSSAEVKERVELHLYSPFGSSYPVQGWTVLLLPDDTKYSLLSEEPIPVPKNPQQTVGLNVIGDPGKWGGLWAGSVRTSYPPLFMI